MTAANDNRLAYGVDDAAEAMSVSPNTVWNWIRQGKIKPVKIGGRTLIRRADLLRLLDAA